MKIKGSNRRSITTGRRAPKADYLRAKKLSISMPGILADQAETRQFQRGLSTLSQYLQQLVRDDVAKLPTA